MKYEKPELTSLASPLDAIQGQKGISPSPDNSEFTVAAYEADE